MGVVVVCARCGRGYLHAGNGRGARDRCRACDPGARPRTGGMRSSPMSATPHRTRVPAPSRPGAVLVVRAALGERVGRATALLDEDGGPETILTGPVRGRSTVGRRPVRTRPALFPTADALGRLIAAALIALGLLFALRAERSRPHTELPVPPRNTAPALVLAPALTLGPAIVPDPAPTGE